MGTAQQYSDDTVAELLAEYHATGNSRLRDEVVEHMRPLVMSIARKFAGKEPVEDLESEGFLGLIRAVDRYTPDRGTRFSTFATHLVAGQIRHYLRDRGHLIRQPAWLQELNARVLRTASELEQQLHRAPTNAEVAAAANLSEEGVEELMAARQAAQVVRMDAADSEDDDYLVVDPEKFRNRDYVTLQLPIEDRIVLEHALEKLKELERKVLYQFFYQDCNQSEIARKLGISCNYTGYILRKGLKHMRERLPAERAGDLQGAAGDSVLDPATGVYNAEYFAQRLNEEISRAQRYDYSLSVCRLRLPSGSSESTLAATAEILRQRTRKADVVARSGENEFSIIFPNTGPVSARVSERLAEDLHAVVGVPVSVVSATYPDAGRTARELLAESEPAFNAPLPLSLGAAV